MPSGFIFAFLGVLYYSFVSMQSRKGRATYAERFPLLPFKRKNRDKWKSDLGNGTCDELIAERIELFPVHIH